MPTAHQPEGTTAGCYHVTHVRSDPPGNTSALRATADISDVGPDTLSFTVVAPASAFRPEAP